MSGDNEVNATEAAIELAKEHEIDLAQVEGTGKEGRIGVPDVQKVIDAKADDADDAADESDEDEDADTQDADEADDADEAEDTPATPQQPVVKKGCATSNFKHNGEAFAIGDKYDGKDAKELRKKGLIK